MLERVIEALKRLSGVERRVDVDLRDLAAVPGGVFRDASQGADRIAGVAADQEVCRLVCCLLSD